MNPVELAWVTVALIGRLAVGGTSHAGPSRAWAMVAPGVMAIAGEGAPPPAGPRDSPAEKRARWVLDRIEEEVAIVVGVDREGERAVPRSALGPGAREGDLLDARLVPDPAATTRARAEVTLLRARLEAAPDTGDDSGRVAPP